MISVDQGMHESDNSRFFLRCESEIPQFVAVDGLRIFGGRIFFHIAHIIEMDYLLKCLEIAVMTIRGRQGDIAQRGYPELAELGAVMQESPLSLNSVQGPGSHAESNPNVPTNPATITFIFPQLFITILQFVGPMYK